MVAVAGVIIAALTLYNNWQERRDAAADKAVEAASATRDKTRFVLRGTPSKDKSQIVLAKTEAHPLGDVRVTFPTALDVGPQDAVDQTIESRWFEKALRKATDGGPDAQSGRLPVLIRYNLFHRRSADDAAGGLRSRVETHGRPLRGRVVELIDLRLRETGGNQARIDALWTKDHPAT